MVNSFNVLSNLNVFCFAAPERSRFLMLILNGFNFRDETFSVFTPETVGLKNSFHGVDNAVFVDAQNFSSQQVDFINFSAERFPDVNFFVLFFT